MRLSMMLLSDLFQLVFQPNCATCGRSAKTVFCDACQGQIEAERRSQALEAASAAHPFPLFAWGHYDHFLRQAIRRLKYHHQPAIGTWLGMQLAQSWIQSGLHQAHRDLLVVPIPMYPDKQKHRGYNQAELISRSFARQVGYRHQPQVLRRDRETQAQYGVKGAARDRNLQAAFSVDPRWQARQPILLIDDIYTTGATLRSAMQVLQAHHASLWGSAVIARTAFEQPFSPPFTQASPKTAPQPSRRSQADRSFNRSDS